MTELRDARFKKALESAPDADARPAPAMGQTIRAAARNALPMAAPKEPPASWWSTLWQGLGQPRSAWGAAFATVLVAVLVTTMWVPAPIPDVRPIAPSASPAAPQAEATSRALGTVASPDSKSAPVPAPATAPAPAPVPVPAPATATATATATAPAPAPAPVPRARVLAAPSPESVTTASDAAMSPPPAGTVAAPQETPLKMADQRAQASKLTEASKAIVSAQSSLEVAGASRNSASRSVAPNALEGMPSAKAANDASGVEDWDALLLQISGRTVTLDRAQGSRLFAVIYRLQQNLSAAKDGAQPEPSTAPDLFVKVQLKERVVATFTVQNPHARWQRANQPARSGTLDDKQVQSLMQLARDALVTDTNVNAKPNNPP